MTITEIHAKHTFAANCYVVRSEKNNAFVVDPGAEGENIIGFMKEHGITPRMILLTHGHFDHVGAVKDLQAAWPGLPVYISPKDQELLEGDDKTGALARRAMPMLTKSSVFRLISAGLPAPSMTMMSYSSAKA